MELDDLKSTWNTAEPLAKTNSEIVIMMKENKHPVLKGIKRQMIIEVTFWIAFLACYYTMFDGASRPVHINVVLAVSVLIPILHNLYGYHMAKHLVVGESLTASLKKYIHRIKKYAASTILSRIVFVTGLMVFFSYTIQFNMARYYSLAAIILICIVQLFLLYKIWEKRIKNLNNILDMLST
ncbi:hypothetical protein [Pedobacter metabolipauper]|uniref:Uncharacterized protein n=1 Tax=Pedobacter metabolipauper TaxID=425513 RepID=A0A4R6T312_9SPHI|nr:hypothetical protein [Pedobacter metabolipauper]TDQ11761.1 hypothetical protein ATK78_0889 [Pedobacter metabolipauper]